jgi:hypothetical protein
MTNIAQTRYLTSTRVDLSSVFMPLQFGGQYPETGYKVLGGADLNTLFCKNYTDVSANKTSLLLSDDQDLSDIFEKRHAVGYSTYVSSITRATRVVYPLSPTEIYYGGDAGTFVKWNGSANSIETITTGATDAVRAIYARNATNVYIGGLFPSGNNNIAYLAKYNGSTFSPVGGLNNYVLAMSALDPSNVYIGGNFTNGGDVGIRISILNTYSNTFTPLISDVSLNKNVAAIYALDPSNVYIGGDFDNSGNIGSYITKWDGEKFNKLGSNNFNNFVRAIYALDSSHVYIGGLFTQYGNDTNMNKIAMWDGTNMIALSNGITEEIRTIYALDEDHVYIGGIFNHIKMWNGRDYLTLSGGAIGLTSCLTMNMVQGNKSTLYFGGAGGVNKWTT